MAWTDGFGRASFERVLGSSGVAGPCRDAAGVPCTRMTRRVGKLESYRLVAGWMHELKRAFEVAG